MIYCKELNKEFESKSDLFKALVENESFIIDAKKSQVYKSFEKGLQVVSDQKTIEKAFNDSEKGIKFDSDYYYFLLGTLTGINGSIRQFFTSNGFTFINGNTITTGKIRSQNENSYFDLDNDEVHFGDAEKYIEWKNSLLKIKGSLAVSPSGVESVIGVFRGTYAINTLYYNGDTVTYGGSTWRYINATAAQNVTPMEGTNWTNISAKGEIGPQGVAGAAGENGVIFYTWIKYANDASGTGISNDPTGKLYIGFAYNKTTATESNNPADYIWSLIKGEQGNTGATGATGPAGDSITGPDCHSIFADC